MSQAPAYQNIRWWHSIDLGNGSITPGRKSHKLLQDEFNRLNVSAESVRGKRVLDIGCNDGFMCLMFERLGAHVVGIDGIYSDGLKYVQEHLKPEFRFYCIDLLSPSFYELGRFDIVLYFGVLYHTVYPFEQMLRVAGACRQGAEVFVETSYCNLTGYEDQPTLIFNYDGQIVPDRTSPVLPSIKWVERTLSHVGFEGISVLHNEVVRPAGRGRVTMHAQYRGSDARGPALYASQQTRSP